MQTQSRIPKLNEFSYDGALMWFSEMKCKDLLFHPEDDPADIFLFSDGSRMFDQIEVEDINLILEKLESTIGHENVIEASYPIFMNAFGLRLDA